MGSSSLSSALKCRKWSERTGLRFGDETIEGIFLKTALQTHTNLTVAWWVCAVFAVGGIVLTIYWSFLNPLKQDYGDITITVNVAFCTALCAVSFIAALILLYASGFKFWHCKTCRKSTRVIQSRCSQAAAVLALLGFLIFFVQQAFVVAFFEEWYRDAILLSIQPNQSSSNDWFDQCAKLNSSGTVQSSVDSNLSSFSQLSLASRIVGLTKIPSDVVAKLLIIWISTNILPARTLVILVGILGVLLIALVVQLFGPHSFANLANAAISAAHCVPLVWTLLMNGGFQYIFAFAASTLALLRQTVIRARMRRELFFWSQKLGCSVKLLLEETSPLQLSKLRRLAEDANPLIVLSRNSSAATVNSMALTRQQIQAASAFWGIRQSEIKLVRRDAEDSHCIKWSATFRSRKVAVHELQLHNFAERNINPTSNTVFESSESNMSHPSCEIDYLMSEVAILGQIDHPSIIRFLGFCEIPMEEARKVLIVQEWCSMDLRKWMYNINKQAEEMSRHGNAGVADLSDMVRTGPESSSRRNVHRNRNAKKFRCENFLRIMTQIADGMKYLHSRGIVHGALKPENILFSAETTPHVRITGFGCVCSTLLSHGYEQNHPPETDGVSTGQINHVKTDVADLHTEYMAPEIFACHATGAAFSHRLRPPIDIYAFGLIAWELWQKPNRNKKLEIVAEEFTKDKKEAARAVSETKNTESGTFFEKGSVVRETQTENDNTQCTERNHLPSHQGTQFSKCGAELPPKAVSNFDTRESSKFDKSQLRFSSQNLTLHLKANKHSNGEISQPLTNEAVAQIWQLPSPDLLDSHCPRPLVDLMNRCCSFKPVSRPSFFVLEAAIDALRESKPTSFVGESRNLKPDFQRKKGRVKLNRSRYKQSTTRQETKTPLLDTITEADIADETSSAYSTFANTHESMPIDVDHNTTVSAADTQKFVTSDTMATITTQHKRPSLCCGFWQCCSLHFGDSDIERKFMLQRLNSDEYYRFMKWVLLTLAILQLLFAAVAGATAPMRDELLWSPMILTVVIPTLKGLAFLCGSLAGWIHCWRWHVNVVIALAVFVSTCCMTTVPGGFSNVSHILSPNLTLTTMQGEKAVAPLDSTFIDGALVGPNGTLGTLTSEGAHVCAGVIDTPDHGLVVSACATFEFELSLGALVFTNSWGLMLVEGTTIPVMLTFLALPLRTYIILLVVPFITTLIAIDGLVQFNYQGSKALTHMMEISPFLRFSGYREEFVVLDEVLWVIADVALTISIYISSIIFAWSMERNHRALFTIHTAMRHRREQLLVSTDFEKYSYILESNRERLVDRKADALHEPAPH